MSEQSKEPLAERVEHLERDVEELRKELRHVSKKLDRALSGLEQDKIDSQVGTTSSSALEGRKTALRSPETERRREARRDHASGGSGSGRGFGLPINLGDLGDFRSGEWWLNKLGIGLLLFGVALLHLLSVERGWIGPPVRVGFGLAVGAALLVMGLRVYENRRTFAQVLLGGGIGAFYITGFAAFQLYALIPYVVAFTFMVAVTLLAFFLSLRQNRASLSLIAALGGLGTPFILYDGTGVLGGLVLYTCLILAGTGAIYFYKGWVSLLTVSFVGGWMVFLVGSSLQVGLAREDQSALQLGVTFAWLLFWLVPVARELLRVRDPAAWSLPAPGSLARQLFGEDGDVSRGSVPAHSMSVATPLVALSFTQGIWSFQKETLGWIVLGSAALYALIAFVLGRFEGGRVAYPQFLVALLLLTLALILVLEGNALFFTLAVEATVLHYVARRFSDRIVSAGAHFLFFVVAAWLGGRFAMIGPAPGVGSVALLETHPALSPTIFNVPALVDLAVIALAFGSSFRVMPRSAIRIYRIAAHLALLAWMWRELSGLPGGDAYVTIAWGLYAVGLLVAGFRLDHVSLARGGMATLFLVVGKLFLVDLAQVEAIWRVLLFLGFGSLFLVLSYYLRSLWKPGAPRDRRQVPPEGRASH